MVEQQGDILRDLLREKRESMSSAHATRLHRAISWLRCAEQYAESDEDISFVALWVSFNSCYSVNDDEPNHNFWGDFEAFAGKLVKLDADQKIYNCLWFNFSNFVRLLIDNKWVYERFWRSQREGNDRWNRFFDHDKKAAYSALANNHVSMLLSIVMERLYTLRNQLVHGGATWQSGVNRDQVRDGKRMLLELMPIIIEIMFVESVDWGDIHYPVIDT